MPVAIHKNPFVNLYTSIGIGYSRTGHRVAGHDRGGFVPSTSQPALPAPLPTPPAAAAFRDDDGDGVVRRGGARASERISGRVIGGPPRSRKRPRPPRALKLRPTGASARIRRPQILAVFRNRFDRLEIAPPRLRSRRLRHCSDHQRACCFERDNISRGVS
ncbi:hypothetical protein NL676_035895 [Syzygium grande]|nr:hypothetical protein NL676_035895 [Syzygium grande]